MRVATPNIQPPWAAKVTRLVAAWQILLALGGMTIAALDAHTFVSLPQSKGLSHYSQFYFAALVANLVCLSLLIVGGVNLWRLNRRGFVISSYTLLFQVLYWLVCSVTIATVFGAEGRPTGTGLSVAFASALVFAGAAFLPQIFTLYPLVGIVLLRITRTRMRESG